MQLNTSAEKERADGCFYVGRRSVRGRYYCRCMYAVPSATSIRNRVKPRLTPGPCFF